MGGSSVDIGYRKVTLMRLYCRIAYFVIVEYVKADRPETENTNSEVTVAIIRGRGTGGPGDWGTGGLGLERLQRPQKVSLVSCGSLCCSNWKRLSHLLIPLRPTFLIQKP